MPFFFRIESSTCTRCCWHPKLIFCRLQFLRVMIDPVLKFRFKVDIKFGLLLYKSGNRTLPHAIRWSKIAVRKTLIVLYFDYAVYFNTRLFYVWELIISTFRLGRNEKQSLKHSPSICQSTALEGFGRALEAGLIFTSADHLIIASWLSRVGWHWRSHPRPAWDLAEAWRSVRFWKQMLGCSVNFKMQSALIRAKQLWGTNDVTAWCSNQIKAKIEINEMWRFFLI